MPQQILAAKAAQNSMWMNPWGKHTLETAPEHGFFFFSLAKRDVIFILSMSYSAESKKQHN